jgi:putative DNA primase/helicase
MRQKMVEFLDAMRSVGIDPPDSIHADGKIHRFNACDKNNKNGWYVLHAEPLAGSFGCWGQVETQNWCSKKEFTDEERLEYKMQMEELRAERKKADVIKKTACRKKAAYIWDKAEKNTKHDYLHRKGISLFGARANDLSVILPVRDREGTLHGLQFIKADGTKKFLTGTAKSGCYFSIGHVDKTICICEGFATGASIYECTGHAVAVAFDSGNLIHVAAKLMRKFKSAKIIICGDNDVAGKIGAEKAAKICNGNIVYPGVDGMDFNDLHQSKGKHQVSVLINQGKHNETNNREPIRN